MFSTAGIMGWGVWKEAPLAAGVCDPILKAFKD